MLPNIPARSQTSFAVATGECKLEKSTIIWINLFTMNCFTDAAVLTYRFSLSQFYSSQGMTLSCLLGVKGQSLQKNVFRLVYNLYLFRFDRQRFSFLVIYIYFKCKCNASVFSMQMMKWIILCWEKLYTVPVISTESIGLHKLKRVLKTEKIWIHLSGHMTRET